MLRVPHAAVPSRTWTLALVSLLLVLPGCINGPDDAAPANGPAIDDGDDQETDTDTEAGPTFTVKLHDGRDEPRDPTAHVPVTAEIAYAPSANDTSLPAGHLRLGLSLAGDQDVDATATMSMDASGTATHTFRLDPAAGDHLATVTAVWVHAHNNNNTTAEADTNDDNDNLTAHVHEATRRSAGLAFTRLAPLTLHLDAHHAWYDDQKTFDTHHTVGAAPWENESGLDVLRRAADIHDFPTRTTYREDLDSTYIIGVNGTEERWERIGPATTGTSWSWMVWLDDAQSDRAIDDTRPAAGSTLALRYLQCDTTGRCQEPPA